MKRITKTDLQGLYGPVPEAFWQKMEGFLFALPMKEETRIMKKKVSFALAMAFVLVLLTVGAGAAVANWDAIMRLYGRETPEMETFLVPVEQTAQREGVSLNVSSVLTDGQVLVFDWALINEENMPLYIETDKLTINGYGHLPAWGDGMSVLWLKEGETKQNGEIIPLRHPLQPGETLDVALQVNIARPKQPVALFDSPSDAQEAERLRNLGRWAVAPMMESVAYRFAENTKEERVNVWNVYEADGFTDDDFTHSTLRLSFTVTVPDFEEKPMHPEQTEWAFGDTTITLTEAFRTPLGIYTTAEVYTPAGEDALSAERALKAYDMKILKEPTELPMMRYGELPESIREEGGKMYRKMHANAYGYASGQIEEDASALVSLGKYVENPARDEGVPTYCYQELSRFRLHYQPITEME